MRKKHTIYDIAKLSGFSPKTVSRVINDEEGVKEETRATIQKVIADLAYTPNVYARNLTRKQTINLLISVKKKDNFPLIWFQTLLDKILMTCKQMGVNTIVEYFGEEDKISDSIIYSSGSLVDGVIIFYESEADKRIEFLRKNRVPFIVFGKTHQADAIYVSNDDYQALYDLMAWLHARDYHTAWMLMGGQSSVNRERVRGAQAFYHAHRLNAADLSIVYGLSTIESVYSYVMEHLHPDQLPDVIFISGDEKVQGFIRACYEKGIRIPQDVAVVGFDNIPISQFYTPALTTISPDYTALSHQLVTRLLAIINGEDITSKEVATQLIERQSI